MIRVVHTGSRIRILIFFIHPGSRGQKGTGSATLSFFYYATNNKALATNYREMTHGGKSKVHCLQWFTPPAPPRSRTKRRTNRKSRQFCMSLAIVLVADKLTSKQCTVPTEIEELMNEHVGVGTLDFTLLALHAPLNEKLLDTMSKICSYLAQRNTHKDSYIGKYLFLSWQGAQVPRWYTSSHPICRYLVPLCRTIT
jgi:hypothetical protein